MTYTPRYAKEQLIALARKRGIYPPEDATDEELKAVERRLSAERGWIGLPQPATGWHTPGWVREKGTATATSTVIGRARASRWPRGRKSFVIPRSSLPFDRADRRTTWAWTPG